MRVFKKFMIDTKEDNFIVLGVPSNDFNQELSKGDVKDFVRLGLELISIDFDSKIRGETAHPLYKWIAGNVSVIGQPR